MAVNKKCIIALISVAVVAIVIGVTCAVLLSKRNGPEEASFDETISTEATFPNGTYVVELSSLEEGPIELAPRVPTDRELGQLGVRVDPSNNVSETGRLTNLYVLIPSYNGRRSKRENYANDPVNIGIRFGDSSVLNVLPRASTLEPNSGLKILGQLGMMTGLELQIRMPASMCDHQASGSCSEVSWTPYSVLGDNRATASPLSSSMFVSCGSQCDSPSGSPCSTSVCQDCDGLEVAGADTPVTRRYKMGKTKGVVTFQYETYTIKDRITVWHGKVLLFDTGCVGASGYKRLEFDGVSDELRVDVEPDCDHGSGTLWNFQLGCVSGRVRLLQDGSNEIKNGDTVYISVDADMPRLTAHYGDESGKTKMVQWKYSIAASKNCRYNSSEGTGRSWDIPFSPHAQGGDAVLEWKVDEKRWERLTFRIRGIQPPVAAIISYINHQPHAPWIAVPIAKHETINHGGYKQFDKDGKPLPSANNDGGFGIFQLTNPRANCSQMWSWKENVVEGVRRLTQMRVNKSQDWMDEQRTQAREETGADVPVPIRTVAKCTFQDGTKRTIEDAVAMKIYNGAEYHYCYWNNKNAKWVFNGTNNYGFDYVERVCTDMD